MRTMRPVHKRLRKGQSHLDHGPPRPKNPSDHPSPIQLRPVRQLRGHLPGGGAGAEVDLLKHLVAYGNQNCEVSMLDGILSAETYEDLFNQVEQLYASQIYAYYFDLPFEETLKRHNQKPISHEVGEVELRSWWREKDFLKNIREKVILKEMDVDDIVEMIYQDLTMG